MSNKLLKALNEEIGRNYKTIDPNPIDFFHDNRISVEIYPGGPDRSFMVDIACDDLNFKSPTRSFPTENEAQTWARNAYTQLSSKLGSLNESLFIRVLSRILKGSY